MYVRMYLHKYILCTCMFTNKPLYCSECDICCETCMPSSHFVQQIAGELDVKMVITIPKGGEAMAMESVLEDDTQKKENDKNW